VNFRPPQRRTRRAGRPMTRPTAQRCGPPPREHAERGADRARPSRRSLVASRGAPTRCEAARRAELPAPRFARVVPSRTPWATRSARRSRSTRVNASARPRARLGHGPERVEIVPDPELGPSCP
jgi:hypothetical protein